MNFRLLFVALCLLAVTLLAAPQHQQEDLLLLEGQTEAIDGCPLLLSEAKSWRPRVLTKEDGSKEIRREVKIQNISGKEVRRASLIFREEEQGGARISVGTATNSIKTGETITFTNSYRTGTSGRPITSYKVVFSVFVVAVEFADNSHWVRPAITDELATRTSLSSQAGHLYVRECADIDTAYRATLETTSDKVAAYRLGVVKDTPSTFEVRVGEWVRMPQPVTPRYTRFTVSAADERVSLPQAQIFQREKLRSERGGRVIEELAGVALFVAEVELVDGTIWKQNLTRDELMWGLYR